MPIKLKSIVLEAIDLPPPVIKFELPDRQTSKSSVSKPYTSDIKSFDMGEFRITPDFLNYMKSVENGIKYNFKNGKWYPYMDRDSSGTKKPAIAYGHRIVGNENYSNGISDSQANELLRKDITNVNSALKRKYGKRWDGLDQKRKEMLIDFSFNGLTEKQFPKFFAAVFSNDFQTMEKEYKRFSNKKEMTDRNNKFRDRFLKK